MTDLMERALAAVSRWPAGRQDEAAELLLALDRLGSADYVASESELAAIDEALVHVQRGEFATPEQVGKAFARFRR
jgi:hypothetical protein